MADDVTEQVPAVRQAGDAAAPFAPPPYLASLIASINDGAKAAQTGALYFAFIGLYLLAVAFSTTDEDLLRQRTIAISQLGMSVPVVFSFAVAPIIFVFLHIHTLLRYDMMAANLGQFEREVAPLAEDNRERCRHLLANVEFLRDLAARPGSTLTNWVFPVVSWFLLAGFPLFVLTVVQLSALRYQDGGIVWAQRSALVAAVAAIVWFVRRQAAMRLAAGGQQAHSRLGRLRRGLGFAALAGLVAANVAWMGVPAPEATTVGHRAIEDWRSEVKFGARDEQTGEYADQEQPRAAQILSWLRDVWQQPVDRGLCPLRFGCRYLRMPHALLMTINPSAEVLGRLRTDVAAAQADLASLEGLDLRARTLRFVDLEDSRLYAAALIGADLRGAFLYRAALNGAGLARARLQGAYLGEARLQGADLRRAELQGADLRVAQLHGAVLTGAELQGAVLGNAQLQGANLRGAELQGADLREARLQGANLRGARLQGANLEFARLQGANLEFAELQGADLSGAQLQGADLRGAQLQGADLSGARLQGADLREAGFWQTAMARSDLSLTDLRSAYLSAPTEEQRAAIQQLLATIPSAKRRDIAIARVEEALAPRTPPWTGIAGVAIDPFILVDDPRDPKWRVIPAERRISDEARFDGALAAYLATLAATDTAVARGIADRFPFAFAPDPERQRALWPDLARRLLDGRQAGTITLPDDIAAELRKFLPAPSPTPTK